MKGVNDMSVKEAEIIECHRSPEEKLQMINLNLNMLIDDYNALSQKIAQLTEEKKMISDNIEVMIAKWKMTDKKGVWERLRK